MLIMDSKLKTLFYLKKPKKYFKGPLPVYLRITLDYPPKELSTGVSCMPRAWNPKNERIKGVDIDTTKNNSALEKLENKVKDTFRYLTENEPDIIITSALIKDKVLGRTVKLKTLLDVFSQHNQQVAALVGRDFASGTLQRYQTSFKHTADFIKHKYKSSDIALSRVDHTFISDYDFYLRSVRGCENNTTVKYLKNFKKIILICLASGYMKSDWTCYELCQKTNFNSLFYFPSLGLIHIHQHMLYWLYKSQKLGEPICSPPQLVQLLKAFLWLLGAHTSLCTPYYV